MDITNVSFPGMGIEAFEVNQVAFALGSLKVYWSFLIMLAGAIFTFFYVALRAKWNYGISKRRTLLITAVAGVLGLLFARAGYVLTTLDTEIYGTFGDVAFGDGLSYTGAIIGAFLAICIMSDLMKINTLRLVDVFVPGVLVMQVLGAIVTFINAELFGSVIGETTSFYCIFGACEIASGEGTLMALLGMTLDKGGEILTYHPVFLYSFIWNLIALLIVQFTYKRTRFAGQNALVYFTFFGIGNAFAQGLCGPRFGLHVAQLLYAIVGVAALLTLIVRYAKTYKRGVAITPTAADERVFSRMMTAEELAEKKAADVAEITVVLDEKAEDVYVSLTAEPEEEAAEEEV